MCLCLHPAHRSPTPHFSEKEDTTDRPFRELAQTPIPLPPQNSPKGAGRGNPSHCSFQAPTHGCKQARLFSNYIQPLRLAASEASQRRETCCSFPLSEACLLQTSSASKGSQLAPKALESLQTVTPTTDLFAGTPKPAESTEL